MDEANLKAPQAGQYERSIWTSILQQLVDETGRLMAFNNALKQENAQLREELRKLAAQTTDNGHAEDVPVDPLAAHRME